MDVQLFASSNSLSKMDDSLRFAQTMARNCYSDKSLEEITKEAFKPELIDRIINGGHHSVFGHFMLTFKIKGIPKILAMILNNEKVYETSEQSARYTQMKNMDHYQRQLYDKWMKILIPRIDEIYPNFNSKSRRRNIKKLAQENARYMTSVFTPSSMMHTLSLRQLNFIQSEFDRFILSNINTSDEFKKRLIPYVFDFLEQTKAYRIPGLDNQTDRHLSLFNTKIRESKEIFDEVYCTSYLASYAAFAQLQRHRTLNYFVSNAFDHPGTLGFFVPKIIRDDDKLVNEWNSDIGSVAETDFPQGRLISVKESGHLEDFKSKLILRLCGHVQYEVMELTKILAQKYSVYVPELERYVSTKCSRGQKCHLPCVWGPENALERLI